MTSDHMTAWYIYGTSAVIGYYYSCAGIHTENDVHVEHICEET